MAAIGQVCRYQRGLSDWTLVFWQIWRPFCEMYKDKVEDYNMATLLRIDASLDYSEENTTLGEKRDGFISGWLLSCST